MTTDPQSRQYKDAEKQLNEITKRQRKRTPEVRHRQRLSALHVEPSTSGIGWNRPHDKSRKDAEEFLTDAANDYAGQYDRIEHRTIRYEDPELAEALDEWGDSPSLPCPRWPKREVE